MTKRIDACVVVLICLWSATVQAGSNDGIRLETSASADSVTVGERFRVVHRLTYPDSLTFIPPDVFDTGTCRLVSTTWDEEREDGTVTKSARLDVMTTDLESAHMPSEAFRFLSPSGDTLTVFSDDVDVPIRLITGAEDEPKPLKPQWRAPKSYTGFYIAAAAVVLAALLLWLFRRWRRREVPEVPKPELPPDFVALRRLDEIERMNLVEAGEFKRHYTLVIDTLRIYIEKRYGVFAMDQTTDEILFRLEVSRIEVGGLESVLREADLVKFAKYRPDVATARMLIDSVRGVVARTAPRPIAVAEASAA